MIGISVNKNLDNYKDDVFKGLSLRQCVFSVLTLLAGGGTFLLAYFAIDFPQMPSVYLTMLAAMPFAVVGFVKKNGMGLPEYLRKKREAKSQTELLYQSSMDYEQVEIPVKLRKSLAMTAAWFFVKIKGKKFYKMESSKAICIEEAGRWLKE